MEKNFLTGYDDGMTTYTRPAVGDLLREWRQRRRLSQLDLAGEAEVSARHLSFVETGRASPSREMVIHLSERLEIPLRERNTLLTAAGYAPLYEEKPLTDPALSAARHAIEMILKGHEPYPALTMDRYYRLISSNRPILWLLTGIEERLLQPPVNVLRLSLHPDGIAPRIANFGQWRSHLLSRLRKQIEVTADPLLKELLREVSGYPAPAQTEGGSAASSNDAAGILVPLKLVTDFGVMTLLSTTTVFGTPVEITLSEIALETFFPADAATADALHRLAAAHANVAGQ